jgi:hypothetical protein
MARKSADEVRKEVERRSEEIAALEQIAQRRGLSFSGLTKEELEKKIKGETSKSPYIYAQGWTSGTGIGSAATYQLWVSNPDPTAYFPVFVTIYFGLGNFADDVAEAVAGHDPKWPYVSSDRTFLAAGGTMNPTFNYTVPMGILAGTYLGNSVLWGGQWHDKGTYFDRGLFDIAVH